MSSTRHSARGLIRPTEGKTRIATALVGIGLVVGAGLLGLARLGGWLLMLSYDLPFLVHSAGVPEDLCIVFYDRADKESGRLARAPMPELLNRFDEAGARAVIYDILFDQEHPVDEEFATAIRRFRGIDSGGNPLPAASQGLVFLAVEEEHFETSGVVGVTEIPPTAILEDAADGAGVVSYLPDRNLARRLVTGNEFSASLTWVAAQALGADLDDNTRLAVKPFGREAQEKLGTGRERWINYCGPSSETTFATWNATDVLADDFDLAVLRDKIVVVGGSREALGGEDRFLTPFHRAMPLSREPAISGTELQAQMLGNLLQGNWLTRTEPRMDSALIVVAGIVLGLVLGALRPARSLTLAVLAVLLLYAAGVLAVHFGDFWFPWSVVAFVQIPVALVWGVGAQFYLERFFRSKQGGAFAKYMSPRMLAKLAADGFAVELGGERVEAAMMFTDLENFTESCEQVKEPEWTLKTLNDYFERTTGPIFENDGVVMQFVGDAIFAAWGVPSPDPEAPRKAVRTAWKLFLNARLMVEGEELRTRIGLHYGEVVAGNLGSSRYVNYTLIGDAVNFASRLESLNKMLHTNILLSEEVYRHLLDGEFCTRRVGRFRFKGKRQVSAVYELIGPARREAEPEWIGTYKAAQNALEADQLERAAKLFRDVDATRMHGDGPSRFFIELLERREALPDGVVILNVK